MTEPQKPAASEEPGRDSDGDVVEEVVNAFLAEFADGATHTGLEHPSADSAPDTHSTPGRTLRKPPQLSYQEPSLYKITQNRKQESGKPCSTKKVICKPGDTYFAFDCARM